MLKPGDRAPDLSVSLLDSSRWSLAARSSGRYSMIAFYRGGFCKYCRAFLESLESHLPGFEGLGFDVVAASTDTETQVRQMLTQLSLPRLRLGYGLSQAQARDWRLFLSERRSGDSPAFVHAEPALHLVAPDGLIYAVMQQSMSCGRPDLESLLEGLEALRANRFPIRGNL